MVTDLDAVAAHKVADEIRSAGGSADAIALDMTSDTSVAALMQALPCPVDVLVNNAGLQFVSRLEDFPIEKWSLLVDVMLTGVARLTRAILPGMREWGFGRVVNTGSVHSLVARPSRAPTSPPNTGCSGSPGSWRSKPPAPTSPSTPSARPA